MKYLMSNAIYTREYQRKNASAKIYANDLHFNWKCGNKKWSRKALLVLYKALRKFLIGFKEEADDNVVLKAFKTNGFMVQG